MRKEMVWHKTIQYPGWLFLGRGRDGLESSLTTDNGLMPNLPPPLPPPPEG